MTFPLLNVLISDDIDPQCIDILKTAGINVVFNTKLSKSELISEIKAYDGLIVRSATKVTADVIEAGTNLKVIGRAGTGVDNIDCDAATKRGILVMNTPTSNTLSATELTCIMICSLSRRLPQATASMREGKWERQKFKGNELMGKTLAIVGLGRIGKEVASRMQAFGMTTIGYDPITPPEAVAPLNIEWLPLDELWSRADYITVHVPLIPHTKHLLCAATFAKCKRGVQVINCARGGVINEADLLEALNSGQCGGAGLDVFEEEPPKNLDLISHPKVISTPHIGASTHEAQIRVAQDIAQQFVDLAASRSLTGAINGHALIQALSPESQPWGNLASSMGRLLAHLAPNSRDINVTVSGLDIAHSRGFLEVQTAAGFLSVAVPNVDKLNLINTPSFTKEMGLKVTVSASSSQVHDCLKFITVEATGCTTKLTGSLCASKPALVAFGEEKLNQPICLLTDHHLLIGKGEKPADLLTSFNGSGAVICGYSSGSEGLEVFLVKGFKGAAPAKVQVFKM